MWLATFYDVGAVYANGRTVAGTSRTRWARACASMSRSFSFIERATLRFDVGKPLNGGAPLQYWFGLHTRSERGAFLTSRDRKGAEAGI